MKTIQEQYNQIKKGKGSKEIFLKEVKRNYPHMVINSATFNQAEEILLNRSVISENIAGVVAQSNTKPDWFKIFRGKAVLFTITPETEISLFNKLRLYRFKSSIMTFE